MNLTQEQRLQLVDRIAETIDGGYPYSNPEDNAPIRGTAQRVVEVVEQFVGRADPHMCAERGSVT